MDPACMDAGDECSWTSLALLLFNSVLVLSSLTPFSLSYSCWFLWKNGRQKRPPHSASVKAAQHQFFFYTHISTYTLISHSCPFFAPIYLSGCSLVSNHECSRYAYHAEEGFIFKVFIGNRLPDFRRPGSLIFHPCPRFSVPAK